jgi:hypothetical protein
MAMDNVPARAVPFAEIKLSKIRVIHLCLVWIAEGQAPLLTKERDAAASGWFLVGAFSIHVIKVALAECQ